MHCAHKCELIDEMFSAMMNVRDKNTQDIYIQNFHEEFLKNRKKPVTRYASITDVDKS